MRHFLLLCFTILIIVVSPMSTSANGTSYRQEVSLPTGQVIPMEEGNVSIVAEHLLIRFKKESARELLIKGSPNIEAEVNVTYELFNKHEIEQEIPIAFPQLGQTGDWQVRLDGTNIPLDGAVALSREQLIGQSPHYEWINPRTGDSYDISRNDSFEKFETLQSKTFTVNLQPRTKQILQVNYDVNVSLDEKHSLHPVYRFDYLLHPASYWSDFQNLTLQIEVPFDAHIYTNLDLEKVNEEMWLGEFETLPDENLVVFLSPRAGILFNNLNSRGLALFIAFVLLVSFYPIGRWVKKKFPSQSRLISCLLLLIFLGSGYDLLSHKIVGYPFTLLQLAYYILYLILILFLFVRLLKK
ncbi:hypothetical protein [Bacillus solimangrovi]|uniref:DUF4436 domain-containing protein n=1 Tax=Bacillus solimangrovi TaxID=1305675 RepID=A0A1E5LKF3_9BACI|nr:hypothetical protein [Bacillus solimangrovi]OEH94551.1 hypothetical protein BFG57_07740 [Bacillus solimangrovi]